MSGECSLSSAGEVQQQHLLKASTSLIILSPSRQCLVQSLASNDDELERDKARAVRVAASRRHPAVVPENSRSPNENSFQKYFSRERVMELLHNCLKLSRENKINQKNSWDLQLIDHLSEIIRTDSDADAEINFQQASCSLEAGVKIYSARVDSVHSDAFKVLSSVIRVGRDEDKESVSVSCQKVWSAEERETKISPLSTVASSFDELNTKKFDVAFTVDPLYHQTSAKFDEGGVKGLLLNNLGVYGSCKLLFDSSDHPRKSIFCETTVSQLEKIDLRFARGIICLDHVSGSLFDTKACLSSCTEEIVMMLNYVPVETSISPTLNCIIKLFNEDNQKPPDTLPMSINTGESDKTNCNNEFRSEANGARHWNSDIDDQHRTVDDASPFEDHHFMTSPEGFIQDKSDGALHGARFDDVIGQVAELLSLQKRLKPKLNSWAGLDHWEYHMAKGAKQFPGSIRLDTGLATEEKRKVRKHQTSDFGFSRFTVMSVSHIFAPPRNRRLLLLSSGRPPCNITLPQDCNYHPESLMKLFLLPDKLCLQKRGRNDENEPQHGNATQNQDDYWGDGTANDDPYNDESTVSDVCDPGDLVSQPRQVDKIEAQHEQFSKTIDVHTLKCSIWEHIQVLSDILESNAALSFREVFRHLVYGHQTSFSGNISPHLCVICLLHLANERHLMIHDCDSLDELYVYRVSNIEMS